MARTKQTRRSGTLGRKLLLIFGIALFVRVIFLLTISRTACLDINLDPLSDMEAFHRWALTIVDGDWLGRSPFHPYHPWQQAIAPQEVWNRWYGKVFHQEPLYPYLIASSYLFLPRVPLTVIVIQSLLGAAGCVFIFLAARRLAPAGAALAAGVLAAFYGPFLFYESLLLRDTILIPLHALLLWVLVMARDRSGDAGAWRRWVAGGLIAGLAFITKASILPFLLLWAVFIGWERRQGGIRHAGLPVLLMGAGFAVAISPVVARNLAVGAPVLQMTTRGPVEFINGNNRWYRGIGWFDGADERVSRYARRVLTSTDDRLLPTILHVVHDWSDAPAGYLGLQARKLGFFFAPFEMPNNASYSYFRQRSPFLRYGTITFFWLSPLAVVGLIASLKRRREMAILYLFLVVGIGFTILFYVIARFRAPLMPAMMILAGSGVWAIVSAIRRPTAHRLLTSGTLFLGVLAANVAFDQPDRKLIRPEDFRIAIQGYSRRGDVGQALKEAEEARAMFGSFSIFHRMAAGLYEDTGRFDEALRAYRRALQRDPGNPDLQRDVQRLERLATP
ncbi:MAG: glycosyltransferase family 39 protein [Acidobacteriota bacterium]